MRSTSITGLALMGVLWVGTPELGARAIKASSDPVRDEAPVTDKDREHWAFRLLVRPEPPVVKHTDQVHNAIDRFILARLEDKGLALSPAADPATLIRRVTFDLTGLPATKEEVAAFQADSSDQAYEALVDRLLASQRHGEHAAQGWLDLARFAETDGFEHDLDRKQSWRYRDWVISAINRDVPYDEFVRLQIAGDELTEDQAIATGFLVAGPDMPDINSQDERRHVVLNEITTTVGAAFLGLTIGCAQCHDHPYDPLSQADFYRLRAFFENIADFQRDKQLPPGMVERGPQGQTALVSIRGDFRRLGPSVAPAWPRVADAQSAAAVISPTQRSSGRRSALATWVARPENGLFLRTTVNRVWQEHFGRALAGSPGDLGTQGEAPTHLELLDWLASELPRQQWSMKSLRKLMVMSATYRQASVVPAGSACLTVDSANLDYSRMNRRRLSGEALRDFLLSAGGRLSLKQGGPGVRLPMPPEVTVTIPKGKASVTEDVAEHDRRSIYVFARRNLRYPLFEIFDRPDALASCARREVSTTAPQSLMLMNSAFSLELVKGLARQILAAGQSDHDAIVEAVSWRCLSRAASPAERALGREFLNRQTAVTESLEEAVSDYCLAVINSSAFCYVD
ncbi:DUF1549 and DUF1553 domain-containing protein [Verrucomicrobium sp. BvORR106]|uniref:DUF1549 and DUF1553 domain-containing protein n=1 Tax=Verrucomicrobium sp. BvORR106 TaxID=1403819 RepID=UPI00068DE31E|nr:DUF1549 and DUF1553 domain-containing protein [Verrucomicrobium sp. BvORR106]